MLRRLAAALICLTLAACGRGEPTGAFAESRTPPNLGPRFFAPEGWAWGFIQTGKAPVQRYGVASTWRAPRANILILPGYGESAEVWFETVAALNRQGYTVWVLDRAGQGGSARSTLPRDLGHVASFDADVANVKAMARVVIRPQPGAPLILLAHADGAVIAARALETGLKADGAILSSPSLVQTKVTPDSAQAWAGRIPLLGRAPAPGWRSWTRTQPDARAAGLTHDRWRGAVAMAWQTANPDLRMSGPSLGWRGALQAASGQATAEADRLGAPTLLLTAGAPSALADGLCRKAKACRSEAISGARTALHLEADAWRDPWLAKVGGFIAARVEDARAVRFQGAPAAPLTAAPEPELTEQERPPSIPVP